VPQVKQSIPQYQNPAEPRKVYRNKFERKIDRQKMRDEAKRQEKLARANEQIRRHQIAVPPGNPNKLTTTTIPLTNNIINPLST
jgi:hypothetical protein